MTREEVNRLAENLRQIHVTAVCRLGSDCIQVDPEQSYRPHSKDCATHWEGECDCDLAQALKGKEPTYHVEMDPAQPAWGREGGFAPILIPFESAPPYSGILQTPLVDLLTQTRQEVPEEEVLRHTSRYNVMTEWYEWTIDLSLEAVRRTPDRRAFRKLFGERLQAVYNEALAEWTKIHGEESE